MSNSIRGLKGALLRCRLADKAEFNKRIDKLLCTLDANEISLLLDDVRISCEWVVGRGMLIDELDERNDFDLADNVVGKIIKFIKSTQVLITSEMMSEEAAITLAGRCLP